MARRISQPCVSREEEVPIADRSRIFNLPFLGLVLSGLVASSLIDLFSPLVRVLLVLLLLTWLPGEVIRARLLPSTRGDLVLETALSFLIGLSVASLATAVMAALRVPFSAYSTIVQVVLFVFYGAFFTVLPVPRSAAARDHGSTPRTVAVVALVAGVFFLVLPPALDVTGDELDHIGYVRAIASENALEPSGVLAPVSGDGNTLKDPRKGMWHPLLALMSGYARVEAAALWPRLPVVLAPVAVLAFGGFASSLLPGTGYVFAAVVLFVMFHGGVGRQFLGDTAYGQHLALAYYWTIVSLFVRSAMAADRRLLVAVLLLVAGGTLVHVDAAIHTGVAVVSLAICHRWLGWRSRPVLMSSVVATITLATVLAWKVVPVLAKGNVLHTHPQGLLYLGDIGSRLFVVSPVELLKKNGLLFLVGIALVPSLLVVRRHRRQARLNIALALLPLLTVFNPLLVPALYPRAGYLVQRCALNIPALVIMVLATGSLIAWGRRGGLGQKIVAVVLLAILSRPLGVAWAAWKADARTAGRGAPAAVPSGELGEAIDYIRHRVPARSVLLSDPVTSYVVSAHSDVRVVSVLNQHGSPSDPLGLERLVLTRAALSPYAGQRETMVALELFGVEYVLVNGVSGSNEYLGEWERAFIDTLRFKLGTLDDVFKTVFERDRLVLYRVVGLAPREETWFPTIPYLEPSVGGEHACATNDPAVAIEVAAVAIEPRRVVAGEEVRVTVTYRKRFDEPQPLPLVLHLRLEDSSYFDAAEPWPGDKLLRRYRERRSGVFYRFRIDHKPFGGLYTPDMWPVGYDVQETFTLRLPTGLRVATYDVQARLADLPIVPNFSIKDFLYNDDSYGGKVCATIDVADVVTR